MGANDSRNRLVLAYVNMMAAAKRGDQQGQSLNSMLANRELDGLAPKKQAALTHEAAQVLAGMYGDAAAHLETAAAALKTLSESGETFATRQAAAETLAAIGRG